MKYHLLLLLLLGVSFCKSQNILTPCNKTLSVFIILQFINSSDKWVDTCIYDGSTFKPIYRSSYSKEVTGYHLIKLTHKRTAIQDRVNDAFFDKAIVTHLKHSKEYRDNNYSVVKDGWFEPATGGNFNFGIQTGFSFERNDITLRRGYLFAPEFGVNPTMPF